MLLPVKFLRRLFVAVATVALAATWAGCSGSVTVPPPDAEETPGSADELPNHIGIDVFLDASLSMQGFATPEGSSTTSYARTLEFLDGSRLLLPNSDLAFYRFGAQLPAGGKVGQPSQSNSELIANRDFRQAFRPAFYADPRFKMDNFLDQIVKKSPLRTLAVIVSDLFQADSDITQLSQSLQERLKAGSVVSLLAIECQYHGTVYDIGSQKLKLNYNGDRPVFALLYGQPAAVRDYGEALANELKKGRIACHLLRLSPGVVKQPVSFAHSQPQELTGLDDVDNLLAVQDDRVAQVRMQPGVASAVFPCDFPFETTGAGMDFDLTQIRSSVAVKRWEAGDWKDEPGLGEAVHVETSASDNLPAGASPGVEAPPSPPPFPPGLRVVWRFDHSRLPAGIYRCDCGLTLEPQDFRLPGWFARADMDVSRISTWQRDPTQYHGEVLNLRRFVEEVWLDVCHQHPPRLGNLHVYLEVPES